MTLRGLFVTGTDTGVGKSVLAAAICTALGARGERVAAFKPAITGLEEPPGDWGHDHQLLSLAASAGQAPEDVAPYRYGPPLSPHYAAELAGVPIDPARLVSRGRSLAVSSDALVVEGVGGFMVPLTTGYLVRDLAVDLALPVVVAARTGLGTISHTLLTVDAVRSAGLSVAGVAMTAWPPEPSRLESSNLETVERLAGVSVAAVPRVSAHRLADAAADLPLDDWLAGLRAGCASASGLG